MGPSWPAAPGTAKASRRRLPWIAGGLAAALIVAGAGAVVGHATWGTPASVAAPSSNAPSGGSPGALTPSGGGSFGGEGGEGLPGFGSGSSSGSGSSVGSGPADAASIAAKVDPGLVDINTTNSYQSVEAAGTGMVLTSNGEILTNNHVIEQSTSISVTDIGNHKTYSASVVGYDRTKDVAVIQLHGASGLQTVSLGDSSTAKVGQAVVGIGNAGGRGGTPSYAGGSITALNQSITASDSADGTSERLTGLIETNANIQPGDSGGPLTDANGKVIGMDTAASAGFQFQGAAAAQAYSIPINEAMAIVHQIEAGQSSSTIHIGATPFMGVEVSPSGSSSGGGLGSGGFFGGGSGFGGSGSSTPSTTSGALIVGVIPNGPAAQAGLASGDTITSLGGTAVTSPSGLTTAVMAHSPGQRVSVGYVDSSGTQHTTTLTFASGPPQ